MIGRCWLALLLLCVMTELAMGRPGTVRTKDGRSIEGDITDKGADGATIKTRAGEVTLRAEDIATIEYAGNIKEAYEKRVAALPKDAGARSRFEIARWLYDNKEYELARKELDIALAIDPNFEDAAVLRQTVDRTMLLDRGRRNAAGAGVGAGAGATAPRPGVGVAVKDRRLLNAEQINAIRVAELRAEEGRVRVRLEKDVAKRFVEFDNRDVREFSALPDGMKAYEILRRGTGEMRKDVKILSDPQAILDFKTRVQPVLLQGCASVACHGGTNSGRFLMYGPADNDNVTYTNFYWLTQLTSKVPPGAEGIERRMIDRTYPNNSLIVQFGLPRERAEFDHPEVAGWAQVYRNLQDQRLAGIVDWLSNGLVPVQPTYGFEKDFPLPGVKPVTQPAPAQPGPPAAEPKPPAGN